MWVFGYGSLIWSPRFDYLERHPATLTGFSRDFCVSTRHHRGNCQQHGLVLGLRREPGAVCQGVAYRVCRTQIETVRDYLARRELVEDTYIESMVTVTLADGRAPAALTYTVNESSQMVINDLTPQQKASIIQAAHGKSGANIDYFTSTVKALKRMGIEDRRLQAIERHLSR